MQEYNNKSSNAYTSFAMVYDSLMDNIPYDDWSAYVVSLLQEYKITKGQVVAELGCGTGKITRRLAKAGYQMLGIDLSEDMLMIARDKQMQEYYESGEEIDLNKQSITDYDHILYIEQDMTELSLNGEVDAFISLCDSMNYLTEEDMLYQTFCKVKEYLKEDGVFIFDMKTPYFYQEILANHTYAEDREEVSYIWENYFDEESRINEYALSLFVPDDEEGIFYQKFQEFHYQKAYEVETVTALVKKAGLKTYSIFDAFSKDAPKKDSERIYYIVGKE